MALAGTGLLTTVGVIVAMDTFGPVSDNAQGIAEMSGDVEGAGAQVLTDLDAVGNTTKAITKGIAIATAVLAAAALFGSYRDAIATAVADVGGVRRGRADAQPGHLPAQQPGRAASLGAAVVFLFSGLAINAVSRSAGSVVYEVRRQFREHPGIMDYTEKPEYGRVVDICTKDALRELATPGLLAVLARSPSASRSVSARSASFLAGAIGTGTLMAVFLANSGGAWDNAKKLVEDGHHGGKGSEAHAATVIGDTVGDPFKDTAGPGDQPAAEGDEPGGAADRPRGRASSATGTTPMPGLRVGRRCSPSWSSSARSTSPSGAVVDGGRREWRRGAGGRGGPGGEAESRPIPRWRRESRLADRPTRGPAEAGRPRSGRAARIDTPPARFRREARG